VETRKQPARATGGMAVTAHPLASAAAIEILAAGGNAVDAAVAAAVAITVVEPFMSTIFGNNYSLIRMASGELCGLDGYGCAPKAAYAGMWELEPDGKGGEKPRGDVHTTGYQAPLVGGALKGMEAAHRRFGLLPWADVLAPAARLAGTGFRASQYFVDAVSFYAPKLAGSPASAAQFMPGGNVPQVGARIVRSEYAETLQLIARKGSDALYDGQIGRAVADDMARNGGLITLEDLRSYQVIEREPLSTTYRGYEVTTLPPASSGGVHVIQMLNILEGYDLRSLGFGTPQTIQALLEAARIAFADRTLYIADPATFQIPLAWLISKEYAAERRAGIALDRAQPQEPGTPAGWQPSQASSSQDNESLHTTHLTIVDGEGNIVTTTQTANGVWGSGVTVPGTGMLLNNGMSNLDPRPGRANSIAPGKRGRSTVSPTLLSSGGRPWVALGTPGGNRIIPAIVQAVSNLIDHGMTLQEAVEAPRCYAGMEPLVELEPDFADATCQSVEAMGHQIYRAPRVAGGMQAIMLEADGTLTGASCWRSDGTPIGFSA
jgi:gamma-glutamyltranspeptidase / glutathione hydrolase